MPVATYGSTFFSRTFPQRSHWNLCDSTPNVPKVGWGEMSTKAIGTLQETHTGPSVFSAGFALSSSCAILFSSASTRTGMAFICRQISTLSNKARRSLTPIIELFPCINWSNSCTAQLAGQQQTVSPFCAHDVAACTQHCGGQCRAENSRAGVLVRPGSVYPFHACFVSPCLCACQGFLLPSVLRIGESHVVHPFKRCGFKSRNRNQHKRGDHVWHQSRPFVVNRHFRARLARFFSGFNRLVSGGNHRRFAAHQQKTPRRPSAQHEPRPGLSYCRGIRPRPAAGNVWRTTACTSLHRRCWRSKRKGAAWQV